MTHPKTAWKFKAWTEAMLRNATVEQPDYGKKSTSKSTGSRTSPTKNRKKRGKRKRKKNAKKQG